MKNAFIAGLALVAAGITAVSANCGAGFCDSMPNGDFALGNIYFQQNHKVTLTKHATLEVVPDMLKYVIENLGSGIANVKNLLLITADGGHKASFEAKSVTVPTGSTVKLLYKALVPLANPDGYCQVITRKGAVLEKFRFSDLKPREWVSASLPVAVSPTDRTLRLECSFKAEVVSDHSILFEYLRLCISYPPGNGLNNGNANYNLLFSELAAGQASGWTATSGVEWKAGDKGDHIVKFKKTSNEESIIRIFDTYPHRAYSLAGVIREDLSYMPFKFYINSVRVRPVYHASSWEIDAVGTQFQVLISNPGKKLNITIVKDRRESCEHVIRPLGLYAHGCVVPKPIARRSFDEKKAVHNEL